MKIKNLIWDGDEAEVEGLNLRYEIRGDDEDLYRLYEVIGDHSFGAVFYTKDQAAEFAQYDLNKRINNLIKEN